MGNVILLISENDDMVLKNLLSKEYETIVLTNDIDLVKKIQDIKPNIILLDISFNGYDIVKEIKKQFINTPLLLICNNNNDVLLYNSCVVDGIIEKPFNEKTLYSTIKSLIRIKSLEKENKDLLGFRNAFILGMAKMSEIHDITSGEHINRIKLFTTILINKIKELYPSLLNDKLASQIILYSPLHDVGKVGIPDVILNKTGTLTFEEFELMKKHTIYGAELLKNSQFNILEDNNNLQVAIEIAAAHHEKFDGTGYPHRLKGENIPLSARIIAIVDIYDALRSLRPYKEALTHQKAVEIILEGDGRTSPEHFDPLILEAFRQVQEEFEKQYK